jgi:hypothetical protein
MVDLGFTDGRMSKSRWWFATWNNPPDGDDPPALGLRLNTKIAYITGQKEKGPLNNTEHFQFLLHTNMNSTNNMQALYKTTIYT